ncbi:hypothetical protein K6119_18945 [Paracrocinitomix mangrovi]|uniref:hypothetical protein n=1 Tax=Paracrocinitomix mangrovi TaxID=2862509 RepID=UPI001C8EBD99|nr:hypothetical protein [Paracrocinitomix mangrovi]UKN01803.1 hypothetical protein K6119_18945 [Paracrocinitomix mangrovi]
MDQDLYDESLSVKEKRGTALLVYAILSWVWIGIMLLIQLPNMFGGKMSAEEFNEYKYTALKPINEDTPEVFINIIKQSIEMAEIQNENFWMISLVSLLHLVIGFLAVFMMFKLKKNGYYLYILYTLVPIILTLLMYPMNTLSLFAIIWNAVIGGVFVLLYGLQLKRMS